LLRRELVRAQARLKRAERQRDDLADENRALREKLAGSPSSPVKPRVKSHRRR
jgi:hypothetical protein